MEIGTELKADHFKVGQLVDVIATTIGKGFAGVLKRWKFGGLRATHGVSVTHRSHGSTGGRQDPGRVFKNKKMAGHMGGDRVTTLNLHVVAVDVEQGVIMVKGSVPGSAGTYVLVRDPVQNKKLKVPQAPKVDKKGEKKAGIQKPSKKAHVLPLMRTLTRKF